MPGVVGWRPWSQGYFTWIALYIDQCALSSCDSTGA